MPHIFREFLWLMCEMVGGQLIFHHFKLQKSSLKIKINEITS